MGRLELQDLAVGHQQQPLISDLNLTLKDGELLSLLGPSGAGKTSLLKTIAGLQKPLGGRILINGQVVNRLPAEKRDIVLIFQSPLLFPFLNVWQNIGFGLRMSRTNKARAEKKIAEIVDLTGLSGLTKRRPHQLSGGQQQRVALARGLVLEPAVLLLDEPLSNLDLGLRQEMRKLVRKAQRGTATTMLFVTHDQGEAFSISDRIALLFSGRIVQTGSPEELFYKPSTPDVARFFGNSNLMAGRVIDNTFLSGPVEIPVLHDNSENLTAVCRPEDILISTTRQRGCIRGRVVEKEFEGSLTRYQVRIGDVLVTVLSRESSYQAGESVWLFFPPDKLHIFSP